MREFVRKLSPTANYPANSAGFLGFPELAFDFRPTPRPTLSQHRAPFRAGIAKKRPRRSTRLSHAQASFSMQAD